MPKTGRISIKGKKRVDKKYQRQSYNIEQKQAILKYWQECNSVESTILKFWPKCGKQEKETKRKLLYGWKEKFNKIKDDLKMSQLNQAKLRPSGVSCVLPVQVEQYLASWIRSIRSEGIPVSNTMVTLQAKILAEEFGISNEKFKASSQWNITCLNVFYLILLNIININNNLFSKIFFLFFFFINK